MVYGRQPPQLVSYPAGDSPNAAVDRELQERDILIRELKNTLETANNRIKAHHNKGRRKEKFQANDLVYLKLKPYRQHSISQKAWHKLGSRFYGPFRVIEKIGEVVYRLDLPEGTQIHPVMHVSQLKRRIGSDEVVMSRLPAVNKEGRSTFWPAKAVEYRQIKKGGHFSVGGLSEMGRTTKLRCNLGTLGKIQILASRFRP